MLLRSSSSPLLNSWIAHQSPDHNHHHLQHRAVVVDQHLLHQAVVVSLPHAPPLPRSTRMTTTMLPRAALSESDLSHHHSPPIPKRNSLPPRDCQKEDANAIGKSGEAAQSPPSPARLLSSSGLDEYITAPFSARADGAAVDGRRKGSSDPENINATDSYYRKMIEADPRNSLLLGNYAKFLKEVRGDAIGARDYVERAILENPSDGLLLSLYAELVWQTSKDARRAESYFDRAVRAAPHDSHVLASYARFLWDVEEDEDGGDEDAAQSNRFPIPPAIQRAAAAAPS